MSEQIRAPRQRRLAAAKSQPDDHSEPGGQDDSQSSRKRAPLMLHDGLPEAIRRLRSRQGLTQEDVAQRVRKFRLQDCKPEEEADLLKFDGRKWSEYENNVKRLWQSDLPNVLAGLGCKEMALWEEKIHVERMYYREQAMEVGEETPEYDTSISSTYIEHLYRLDVDLLPPDERAWFHDFRNSIAVAVANTLAVADQVISRYRQLKLKAGNI